MHWFFIALAAPILWAFVNIADQYLISKYSLREKERSSGGLVIFSSLIGILIALTISIFVSGVFNIPLLDKALLLLAGAFTAAWIILYLFALEIEDVSAVIPWFLAIPIFGFILGYIFLGETLNFSQMLGSAIVVSGLILISFNFGSEKKRFNGKIALYMTFASLIVAASGVIFKYVSIENNYWVCSFWEYLGLGLTGFLIYIFIPHHRAAFMHMHNTGGRKILFVNLVSELMTISGNLLTNFALLLAPVAMVFLVETFQPAIVLILTIIGTKFFPHIVKENLSLKVLFPKIIALILMAIGSAILFL